MGIIRTTLRLPEELHEAITDEAWKTRRSMNQLIVDVLRKHTEDNLSIDISGEEEYLALKEIKERR